MKKLPNKREIAAMKDVKKRSKGLPVGIPIEEKVAKSLVEKGLAKWAVPAWNYPVQVWPVSLTLEGESYT